MTVVKMKLNTLLFVLLHSLRSVLVLGGTYSTKMILEEEALTGRDFSAEWEGKRDTKHFVNKNRLFPPFPEDTELAMFAMGCFWGAEKRFWETKGVYSTQVGYSNGFTKHPTYREVCDGMTGHAEVVRIVFKPEVISFQQLLKIFWENHDPTQGMRQGEDSGTQYRSGVYYYNELQKQEAESSKEVYEKELLQKGYGKITTEIKKATELYYAEEYHQQYFAKNANNDCSHEGTGVFCPSGLLKDKDEL